MKKEYLKPDAEYINFYSEEEITLDVQDYAYSDDPSVGTGGVSGDMGTTDKPGSWQ